MAGRSNTKKEALQASTAIEVVLKSDIQAEEAALTPEQEKELADCAERLVALGRRSTVQAFDYGEELARAQAILPPKKYGQWVKANCGISTRAAKNYARVYKELFGYRDRLEKVAAAPTAMFALLGAEGDAVEAVLDAFENGERLTVAKIKSLTGTAENGETLEVNVLDMPGRAGALKVGEARLKANIAAFYDLLSAIFPPIEEAAEKIAAGQRVIKADLAGLIELDSRHAHDLFELTLAPFMEGYDPRSAWRASSVDPSTTWGKVQNVLYRLGNDDDWPKRDAFKTWIAEEVYPVLNFAVRGEPLDMATGSTKADEAALVAGSAPGDLIDSSDTNRLALNAPALQSDNVVELAPRQKGRKAVEATDN